MDFLVKLADAEPPSGATSTPAVVTPTVVTTTPVAVTPAAPSTMVPLPTAVLAIVLAFLVAWHFSGVFHVTHTSHSITLDWSGLAPVPPAPVPFVPPIPPAPKPAPVIAGPIHVTLVTDPADDSPANAPLRTALAIQAAFGSLDAHWHHLTTDDQLAAVGFTKYIAKVGKPSLFVQTADGGLVFPPSKAPDTEDEIIAKVKSLRGVK